MTNGAPAGVACPRPYLFSVHDSASAFGPRHVVLVSCSGVKLDSPAPARDLYQSQLFRKSRAWAERFGSSWFILSALHGLIAPEVVIAPYDLTLAQRSPTERRQWDAIVLGQLAQLQISSRNARVSVLAGQHYTGWCDAFGPVEFPLRGLGIGQRLAWLKSALAA